MNQKIKTLLKSFFILTLVALSAHAFAIWTPPTALPTGGNTEPPINVGLAGQIKTGNIVAGGFGTSGLGIFGAGLINDFLQVGGHLTAGTFQVTSGTPAIGKVLTSDASGNATWQPLPPAGVPSNGSDLANGTSIGQTLRWDSTIPNSWQPSDVLKNTGAGIEITSSSNTAPFQLIKTGGGPSIDFRIFPDGQGSYSGKLGYVTQTPNTLRTLILQNLFPGEGIDIIPGTNASVGINVQSPYSPYNANNVKLDINGSIRINDGNQVSGRVLTSDSNGVGTWQTSSTGLFIENIPNNAYYQATSTRKLGLGTPSPATKLDIVDGTARLQLLQGTNTSGYTAGIGVNNDGVNFSNSSQWRGFNFKNPNGTLLTIKENGTVGIGTSTPNSLYKLEVNGPTGINGPLGVSGDAILAATPGSKVGIGVSSSSTPPSLSATLDVDGSVRFRSAGTPAAGKILTSDASGNATWQPVATGPSGPWTKTGTNIFNTVLTDNVGVGIASPSTKLHVAGDILATGKVNLLDTNHYIRAVSGQGVSIGTYQAGEPLFIQQISGYVGIGDSSPEATLDVGGRVRTKEFKLFTNPGVGKVLTSDADGEGTWQTITGTIAPGTISNATMRWNGSSWVENGGLKADGAGTVTVQDGRLNVMNPTIFPTIITGNVTLGGASNNIVSVGQASTITTQPGSQVLNVGGTVKIRGGNPGNGKVLTSNADGDATWQDSSASNSTTKVRSGVQSATQTEVMCPSTHPNLLGGGGTCSSTFQSTPPVSMTINRPKLGSGGGSVLNGWEVRCTTSSGNDNKVEAFAICSK